MLRLLLGLAMVLGVVAIAAAAWVRLAPDDPARWAVDPLTAPGTGKDNSYRVGPEGMGTRTPDAVAPNYAAPASEVAAAFDAFALDQPRTTRLSGGPDELAATYVQRSRVFGFPDYVSVRFIDLPDGGSTVAIYSRARYGQSDLGVNRARVEKWLAALAPFAR